VQPADARSNNLRVFVKPRRAAGALSRNDKTGARMSGFTDF
jgi:hypothetical protein